MLASRFPPNPNFRVLLQIRSKTQNSEFEAFRLWHWFCFFKWVKKIVREVRYDQMKIVWKNLSLASFLVQKSCWELFENYASSFFWINSFWILDRFLNGFLNWFPNRFQNGLAIGLLNKFKSVRILEHIYEPISKRITKNIPELIFKHFSKHFILYPVVTCISLYYHVVPHKYPTNTPKYHITPQKYPKNTPKIPKKYYRNT